MDPSFHDLGGFSNRGRYYKKPTILLWGYHGIGMIRYDIYIYITHMLHVKTDGYGALLDVQISFRVAGARDCAPCQT